MATNGPTEVQDKRPAGPMVKREEFGSSEMRTTGETASSVVAAQATAEIQARYIMALQRPRDLDDVRLKMLKECKRPSFAKVAIYHKPVGKGIEGMSIRFAEAAIRCMGNIAVDVIAVFDDPHKRILRVAVVDIENNVPYSSEIVIEKTVERSKPKEGTEILGARQNSNGQMVYLVPATEDDLLNKQNALVSKAVRTNGLRHIPGDIVDECRQLIYQIRDTEDAQDPDAARKKIADGFAELGVLPSGLKDYLAHDLATSTPAEMKELRGVYALLRDGEMSWPETLEAKKASRKEADGGEPAGKGSEKLKEKLKSKAAVKDKPVDKAEEKPTAATETPATEATPSTAQREPGDD